MPGGAIVVAGLAGGLGFGVGADNAEGGVEGAEPGQTQLFADVAGRPGGLGRVDVAEQPQPSVGQGADAGSGGRADGEEGFVPGGPLSGCLVARFGADWVTGVVVPVHLPVGGDRSCLVLPVAASGRDG